MRNTLSNQYVPRMQATSHLRAGHQGEVVLEPGGTATLSLKDIQGHMRGRDGLAYESPRVDYHLTFAGFKAPVHLAGKPLEAGAEGGKALLDALLAADGKPVELTNPAEDRKAALAFSVTVTAPEGDANLKVVT